jgi:hypothetical protein
MKYRAKSLKIKYQHAMIKGLREFLEVEIQPLPYVKSIIPGRIERTKGRNTDFFVRFQYKTETGAKLIAHRSGVVQEVFVVTSEPEKLKQKIENTFERKKNSSSS